QGRMGLERHTASGMNVIVEYTPLSEATSKVYSIIRVLSEAGKNDLEALGISALFDYPKPVEFVKQVIQMVTMRDKEAFVLDFFAGSATTGQAVMQLNAQDGGQRRYLQIQLPEPTEAGSNSKASGFLTISQI